MNMNEFVRLVKTYGANIERWPRDRQKEANRLLATSIEARSLISEAKEIGDLLDLYLVEEASDLLIDKIVSENTSGSSSGISRVLSSSFTPSYAVAAGIVFCLLLGFMLGFLDVPSSPGQIPAAEIETILLGPIADAGVI